MKKILFVPLLLSFVIDFTYAQTLAEKLGYEKEDKLLIIHGDDVGVSHSQNKATFQAMAEGLVTSTSMMVPSGWSFEVGQMAKKLSNPDIGIHITLTNEWEYFNWGPKAGRTAVPGLADERGHMYSDCGQVLANATPEEVEMEIRAQIKAAQQMGINPTHLDSHMGCIFYGRPEYLLAYLKIAQELKIPAMLNQQIVDGVIGPNPELFEEIDLEALPLIDQVFMAEPKDYESGMAEFYEKTLNELPAGVHVLLLHLAFDDEEMNAVTTEHDTYHAPWRQADYDFFTSDKARELIEKNNIKLITWRQIGELL